MIDATEEAPDGTPLEDRTLPWVDGYVDSVEKLATRADELADIYRAIRANVDMINGRVKALQAWLEKENAPLQKKATFLESHIRLYADTNREQILAGYSTKSRTFPGGLRIGWKKGQAGLEIGESEALEAWAVGMGLHEVRPSKALIREHYDKTGEVPPDCSAKSEEDEFYIKPEGEK